MKRFVEMKKSLACGVMVLAVLSVGTPARPLFAVPLSLDYTVAYVNPFQTVGPTEVVPVFVSISNSPSSTVSIDFFNNGLFTSGTLFGFGNPYDITLGPTDITDIAPGATSIALLYTLSPKSGLAPFGTFSSPDATVRYRGFSGGTVFGPTIALGSFTLAVVPEPSTLLLLASGLAGLAAWRRRKAA